MRAASFLLFSASWLIAQHQPPDPGHSQHGATFDEGPRQAAHAMVGLSEQVHFPVDGLDAAAQAMFDQGLCQQHGFWYFEAERSFRQVAALHPDCAMAYWGMALANVEQPERAAGFIAEAVRRSAAASAREQQWIDAWARLYQLDDAARGELRSGDAARVAAAIEALRKKNKERPEALENDLQKQLVKDLGTIVFEHPDDIEAKALLALQNWLAYRWGSGVPIVSHAAVDALLQQVFERAPQHPAHHYRIHLWDQEDARRALPSAARIGGSAPAIAHQWHMAGHIYAKLDRHAEAAWQQEASSRADHAHMARDRVMPFLIHNYGHNQEWLARSLGHCGRVEAALQIAKNLAELPRHPKWNRLAEHDSIAGYARSRLVQLCEDFRLWQTAVDLAAAGYLEAGDDVLAEAQRLGLAGRAAFRLGRSADGERVLTEVEALLVKARQQRAAAVDEAEDKALAAKSERPKVQEAMAEAARQPTDAVQAVLDLRRELRGEQLLAQGDGAGALAEFEAIEGLPKRLLADAQLAAGKVDEAVEALQKENDKRPHRAATLWALLRAIEAQRGVVAQRGVAASPEAGASAEVATEKPTEKAAEKPTEKPAEVAGEAVAAPAANPAEALAARQRELVAEIVARTPRSFWQRCGIGADFDESPLAAGDPRGFGEDFGTRPALASLGPKLWLPVANPGFELPAIDGSTFGLPANGRGRATLVVFYLGFGCLHCVEQLHLLRPRAEAFAAQGIDVVAIGSDDLAATRRAHDDLAPAERLPFPLLADPGLASFRAWHCHDDFEGAPLHGTFLVDAAGRVRWQDISSEPFTELDWLVGEARRLLALQPAAVLAEAPPR